MLTITCGPSECHLSDALPRPLSGSNGAFLSDAVSAIVITLLVLPIAAGFEAPDDDTNLIHVLGELWPHILSFSIRPRPEQVRGSTIGSLVALAALVVGIAAAFFGLVAAAICRVAMIPATRIALRSGRTD